MIPTVHPRILPRLAPTVVVLLLVTACSGSPVGEPTTTTTTPPTTTTTTLPPTTTTTLPQFTVEGAPDDLKAVIEWFYDYAAGDVPEPPPVPDHVIAGLPAIEKPLHGIAATGAFRGHLIAVAEVGADLFLAIDDGDGWRILGGSWPAAGVEYLGPAPRLVAVVGSDARPGENPERTRADSLHIVGFDGQSGGAIVGIPRDAYVPVPGLGRRKITGALALGGPDVLFAALKNLTGLPLEGYLLTGFEGFQQMVGSVLGGIDIDVPFAIADRWAKAYFDAGLQRLTGKDALALARPRKTVPGGDFARSELQGLLMLGAGQAVQTMGVLAIPALIEESAAWLFTDLSAEQLLTLSVAVAQVDLDAVPNIVVPGRTGSAAGASVVFLSDTSNAIWEDLTDGRLGP
jgi:polyisoprenyl-teichoic acid--peptidoglycan teichoic acid transferase